MEYVLDHSTKQTNWSQHPFYTSALVLGLDIGIEGIGVWLRQGRGILFAQTFLVSIPEAAPLAGRRQKRAWRRARASRRHRDHLFKQWIIDFQLLPKVEVERLWSDLKTFQTPFELRHRAMVEKKTLASPHALISCMRQLVRHRGYDYHMTEEGAFPWGDTLDPKEITKWAKHSWVDASKVQEWIRLLAEQGGLEEKELAEVTATLQSAVLASKDKSIEAVLARHMTEKNHTNLRERARNHNFPREQIKAHARLLLRMHTHLFPSPELASQAEIKLLGTENEKWEETAIMDYHRRSPAEVKALWERKRADCPYTRLLVTDKAKCSLNSDLAVRQWKLLHFLAERAFVGADAIKRHAPADLIKDLLQFIAQAQQEGQPKPELFDWKKRLEESLPLIESEQPATKGKKPKAPKRVAFAKGEEQNKAYLQQLRDLLQPKRAELKKTSGLSSNSAQRLFNQATADGTCFRPAEIRERLTDYYHFRRNNESQAGLYPQVEYLLGSRKQYHEDGTPKDRCGKNGQPQYHGILRRLFANQLKDAHGRPILLPPEIIAKRVPDYVVVEVVGDIPRNTEQKKEILSAQKENGKNRKVVLDRYGQNLSSPQIRKVLLFDQQVNQETRKAFCPFTGQNLGTAPLSRELQVAHLFPEDAGGINELTNLCLTTTRVNQAMGKRTPRMCAGQTIDGVTFLSWSEMEKLTSPFLWNKRKRELFAWKDLTEIPDWNNLTRQSQLARQLRQEVIHWLGIKNQFNSLPLNQQEKQIGNEIARRIGTATGFQTSVCRESWKESLPEFMREKKQRGNLRHHLYDAAVVSFIPPGAGLNDARYGGIFESRYDEEGCLRVTALPGLLPDLQSFEAAHQAVSLVQKPRQKKSKAARYDESIFSLSDEKGINWKREKLVDAANKKSFDAPKTKDALLPLFKQPGLISPYEIKKGKNKGRIVPPLLTEDRIKEWDQGRGALTFNAETYRSYLLELGIPLEILTAELLKQEFQASKTGHRTLNAQQIIAFIRKRCQIPALQLSDLRVENDVDLRSCRAELRSKPFKPNSLGQIIRNLPVQQNTEAATSLAPHFDGNSQIIGLKSSKEAFYRYEIWRGPKRNKQGIIEYDTQGQPLDDFFRLLLPHPRNLAAYKKRMEQKWEPEEKPPADFTKFGHFEKGYLVLLPLDAQGELCDWGQKGIYHLWYRVSVLAADAIDKNKPGQIALLLAEHKNHESTSIPHLENLAKKQPKAADTLAWILETTRRAFRSHE